MVSTAQVPGRTEYDAARQRAAVIHRPDRGFIVLSGADRASYLHGLLTNDITALGAGRGCYAAYLTPQGRMITDLWVYELGDVMLVSLPAALKDSVLAKLDQFLFTEDVQLGDATATFQPVSIVGPGAAAVVQSVLEMPPGVEAAELPAHGNARGRFAGQSVVVLRVIDTGEPGYDLLVERAHAPALREALVSAGAVETRPAVAETLRIEAGVPRFGQDMDEETIPLEAGIDPGAISLTKGCYVGQEVIVRILHRGHGRVARRLVGIVIEGADVPAAGALVRAGEREAGHVTSAAASPALGRPVALAYLHRDFVDPGTEVSVGAMKGRVTALPFVSRSAS